MPKPGNSDPAIPLWEVLLEEAVALDRPIPPDQPDGVVYEPAGVRFDRLRRDICEAVQICPDRQLRDIAGDRQCLAELYKRLHLANERQSTAALCLSGGGIRSATFCLGIIQGMSESRPAEPATDDRHGVIGRSPLLDQFAYLSTVSGGGYIGAWLSAWINRSPGGVSEVAGRINGPRNTLNGAITSNAFNDTEPAARQTSTNSAAAEVTYLRDYTNYLAPRGGLLGRDAWTLFSTYLSHLALNWLVLLPLMTSVVLTAWSMTYLFRAAAGSPPQWWWFAIGGVPCVLGTVIAPTLIPTERLRKSTSSSEVRRRSRVAGSNAVWLNVIVPVLGGSFALAVAWYALCRSSDVIRFQAYRTIDGFYWHVVLGCAAMGALAAMASGYFILRHRPEVRLDWTTWLRSILVYAVAAVVTGISVFGLACAVIPRPSVAMSSVASTHGEHSADRDHAEATRWQDVDFADVIAAAVAPPLEVVPVLVFFTLVVGLTSERYSPFLDYGREWWAALSGRIMRVIVLWLTGMTLMTVAPYYLLSMHHPALLTGAAVPAAIATLAALANGASAKGGQRQVPLSPSLTRRMLSVMPDAMAAVALVLLLTIFSCLVAAVAHRYAGTTALQTAQNMLLAAVSFAVLAVLVGFPINANRFSLHGMYRSRIIRAYLGASRANLRDADPFTEFDPQDNVLMHRLRRLDEIGLDDLVDAGRLAVHLQTPSSDQQPESRLVTLLKSDMSPPITGANSTDGLLRVLNAALNNRDLLTYTQLLEGRDGSRSTGFLAAELRPIAAAAAQSDHDDCRLVNRLIIEHLLQDAAGPLLKGRVPRPLHVINAALNLVGHHANALAERKACNFTISCFHSGFDLGYRPSVTFGDGITLGTAMTLSGAAVSPNMGYHSSRAVSLLMMLFNVRLGCWLGNPARPSEPGLQWALTDLMDRLIYSRGRRVDQLPSPRFSAWTYIAEAFGRTTDRDPYIYLSDGGHFDNLGLYAMVQRRCDRIVICDASCDPKGELFDLAAVVRKVRIDLGVAIEMKKTNLRQEDNLAAHYCAVGRVRYDLADGAPAKAGLFVYIKPTLAGNEPLDVFNFGRNAPDFPHETTMDQFFSESQFESYRTLGRLAVTRVMEASDAGSVDDLEGFFEAADIYAAKRERRNDARSST